MDYRAFLQTLGSNTGLPAQEARALHQVVGNDFGVDEGFLNQQQSGSAYNWNNPGGANYDSGRGQIYTNDDSGQNYYYGPQGISALNDKYKTLYNNKYGGGQTLGVSTGGSTSGSGTNTAQELEGLNSQQSLYERLLESINSTEQSGINSLNDSENSARNNANTQRGRAMEDFAVKRQSTERGRDSALNTVGDNSRMLRDSLMRRLGLGAGGGSAFQMGDQAVARDASKNRQGVLNSYGENFMQLGTSEKRAEEDYTSLLDEITADRRAKEQALKAGIFGQRQGIQESLGQIAGDRASLQGGNPISASAPYRNNYLSLQNQVDQLPQQYRTQVDARALNVQTPTLRDYVVDRASINQQKQSGQQQYSPYSAFLNRGRDEEEQLNVR